MFKKRKAKKAGSKLTKLVTLSQFVIGFPVTIPYIFKSLVSALLGSVKEGRFPGFQNVYEHFVSYPLVSRAMYTFVSREKYFNSGEAHIEEADDTVVLCCFVPSADKEDINRTINSASDAGIGTILIVNAGNILKDCSWSERTITVLTISNKDELLERLKKFKFVLVLTAGDLISINILDMSNIVSLKEREVIYVDHDHYLESAPQSRIRPFFKPDFEPNMLLVQGLLDSALMLTARHFTEVLKAHDFPENNYQIMLMMMTSAVKVTHIDAVLCHKPAYRPLISSARQVEIVRSFTKLENDGSEVVAGPTGIVYLQAKPRTSIKISVIIPTRDKGDLLRRCIESLIAINSDLDLEIIVLNNGSTDCETLRYLDSIKDSGSVCVIDAQFEFNWARLNNIGAEKASGEVLVFLNNDMYSTEDSNIGLLAAHAIRDDIGVVGPCLLYPDGKIQHAGMVLGYGGSIDHVFSAMLPDDDNHSFINPLAQRYVSALTGACQVIEKKKFVKIGSFNEEYAVTGSDVDLCFKSLGAGYHNLYDGSVKLIHYEATTRNLDERRLELIEETSRIVESSSVLCLPDPFFNKNLSLSSKRPVIELFCNQ